MVATSIPKSLFICLPKANVDLLLISIVISGSNRICLFLASSLSSSVDTHLYCRLKRAHALYLYGSLLINFVSIYSILTYLLTYLLTPWCRVLLEKLTSLHLVKKFPAFHGTRRFITALTSVRHLSLSWASPIQSIYPHPTS